VLSPGEIHGESHLIDISDREPMNPPDLPTIEMNHQVPHPAQPQHETAGAGGDDRNGADEDL